MQSKPAFPPATFSPYQKFVVAVLAFLQFTIILDFMIIGPLGALLLQDLHITTAQFGFLVSVYAWSAGVSGLLAAGFADKFDRKKLLLFFYCGFLGGTLLCGLARSYGVLLFARIFTGVFGGVVGSVAMAILADLFPLAVRGRVMGTVQTAFAASQVLGLPFALFLSNHWGWQAPFIMVFAVSAAIGVVIAVKLKPIDTHLDPHLNARSERNPLEHLLKTVRQWRYLRTFAATMLLATGGYMLMPFGSTFAVNNLGIPLAKLPMLFMITGVVAFVAGPLLGRLADRVGKYLVFCVGSALAAAVVAIYCNLGVTTLGLVVLINSALFVAITARMITAMALTSAVPDMQDRGAFMSVNASLQQFSGGIASSVAGVIVIQQSDGHLAHYDLLGYVVAVAVAATVALMYPIHKAVMAKAAVAPTRPAGDGPASEPGEMSGPAPNDVTAPPAAAERP